MILTEIVSQHVEEAAFLWLLRSNAVFAGRQKGVRDGDAMDQCD